MKYPAKIYAQALLETLNTSPRQRWDKLIKNCAELIARNGDFSLADKITAAAEKLWTRQNGGRMVTVETARPIDEKLTDQIKNFFAPPDHVDLKTNPRLIAGVRITADDKELDNSLAAKLNKIFA